jgi:hypothetical protein
MWYRIPVFSINFSPYQPLFPISAAKVLQHTAKTCQYGEENTKKMQKSDFFCIFFVYLGRLCHKKGGHSPCTPAYCQ